MAINGDILKEVAADWGYSNLKGCLGGKGACEDFLRRVVLKGNINDALTYDDGLNGIRNLRPVEIADHYAYHDLVAASKKAGADLAFEQHGRPYTEYLHHIPPAQYTRVINGESDIDLRSAIPARVVETDLERQLRKALVNQNAHDAIIVLDAGANPGIRVEGAPALHVATRMQHTELMDKIIKGGVSVDVEDTNNYRPLHNIASETHTPKGHKVIEYLLDHGANPYAGAWAWKNTILHTEISNERPQSALALIDIFARRGLHFETPDCNGKTVLHLASMVGLEDVVQKLIAKGASVHAVDKFGCTPLHYAALRGSKGSVSALRAAGAKMIANAEGKTPLDLANSGEETLHTLFRDLEIDLERGASAVGNQQGRRPGELTVLEDSLKNRGIIANMLEGKKTAMQVEHSLGRGGKLAIVGAGVALATLVGAWVWHVRHRRDPISRQENKIAR